VCVAVLVSAVDVCVLALEEATDIVLWLPTGDSESRDSMSWEISTVTLGWPAQPVPAFEVTAESVLGEYLSRERSLVTPGNPAGIVFFESFCTRDVVYMRR